MSEDKRLGADPLDWIARERPDRYEEAPAAGAAPDEHAKGDQPGRADPLSLLEVRREDKQAKARLKSARLAPDAAAALLEALAAGMRAGRLELGAGAWSLTVGPGLEAEVKIEAKKDKASCNLELTWRLG